MNKIFKNILLLLSFSLCACGMEPSHFVTEGSGGGVSSFTAADPTDDANVENDPEFNSSGVSFAPTVTLDTDPLYTSGNLQLALNNDHDAGKTDLLVGASLDNTLKMGNDNRDMSQDISINPSVSNDLLNRQSALNSSLDNGLLNLQRRNSTSLLNAISANPGVSGNALGVIGNRAYLADLANILGR